MWSRSSCRDNLKYETPVANFGRNRVDGGLVRRRGLGSRGRCGRRYGDRGDRSAAQLPRMAEHWVRLRRRPHPVAERTCGTQGFQFGDWLDPDGASGGRARGQGRTQPGVVATACFFRSAVVLSTQAARRARAAT